MANATTAVDALADDRAQVALENGIIQYRTLASIQRATGVEVNGEITISINLAKLGIHLAHALRNKNKKASLAGGIIAATVTDGPYPVNN